MRPIVKTLQLLPTTDADGIFEAQTPGAAGSFTLDGVLVSSDGVAVLDTNGNARQVTFTSDGNDSGDTYTIRGRLSKNGNIVEEALAGPNATTVASVNYWIEIIEIQTNGAGTGSITAGTNAVGSTPWIPVNNHAEDFKLSMEFDVSGTINYSLQYTYDNVQDPDVIPFPRTDATITSETADETAFVFTTPVKAVRVQHNSGDGSVVTTIIQQGNT